jgi:antitoxin (DNA-binding transcriptional repressor) of toxin-antitoxin stability system
MIAVGIRDMKNRLSEYIRRAQDGEVVVITDRGKVVAQLTRPGVEGGDFLTRLQEQGLLARRGTRNDPSLYPELRRVAPNVSSMDLLDELRREG